MKQKAPRKKKCAFCLEIFQPTRPFQNCCGPLCAIDKAKADRAKKEKKELVERRNNAMPMKKRQARARKSAQEYARLRDMRAFEERGELPKCIMCGNENPTSWHGCHFVSVGSKGGPRSLHPANINLGCGQCNFFRAQNDTQYRENMIVKYGAEMVEYLTNAPLDYAMCDEEVDEIWKYYRSEIKRLSK